MPNALWRDIKLRVRRIRVRFAMLRSLPRPILLSALRHSFLLFLAPLSYLRLLRSSDKDHFDNLRLPSFPQRDRKRYDYYKLKFLPDSYPGEYRRGRIVPHPLYGAIVINNYLKHYHSTRQREYLDAAIRIAKASIHRMREYSDGLVFWYEPESGLTSMPTRFYSGLTQSRYLVAFAQLYQLSGDTLFGESSEKVLNSFFIEQRSGGVLKRFHSGVSIEEYPNDIPLYTLNGWLTAIINIKHFADMTHSEKAQNLFIDNVNSVEKIVDLYDVEDLANTRYNLSGPIPVILKFLGGFRPKITRASIHIPKEGDFGIQFHSGHSLWQNFIEDSSNLHLDVYAVSRRKIRLNVVLSMISFPDENKLSFQFETSTEGTLEAWIGDGDYDLFSVRVIPTRWLSLGTFHISPENRTLSIPISWDKAKWVAYPTNFAATVAGRNYNTYHYIHIIDMQKLYDYTKREKFHRIAQKWLNYTKRWQEMEPYKGSGVELRHKREAWVGKISLSSSSEQM